MFFQQELSLESNLKSESPILVSLKNDSHFLQIWKTVSECFRQHFSAQKPEIQRRRQRQPVQTLSNQTHEYNRKPWMQLC